MKLKLMAMAALAACVAAAMPTKKEVAQANNEVRELLKARIADWKSGRISDKSFAQFMYGQALQYKYKDEARFYACLQSAFAVAVRADNAKLAAKVIETLASDIKGFDDATEEALIGKALAKIKAQKAKSFRERLESERAKLTLVTYEFVVPSTLVKMVSESAGMTRKGDKAQEANLTPEDWMAFFSEFGVMWPKGSTIRYEKAGGKIIVTNRREHLANLDKVLFDLYLLDRQSQDAPATAKPVVGTGAREAEIIAKMKRITLRQVRLGPPTTLEEAVEFMRAASREYDDPAKAEKDRGINFVLKVEEGKPVPVMPDIDISAKGITLYDLVKGITEISGYGFTVRGNMVIISKKGGADR